MRILLYRFLSMKFLAQECLALTKGEITLTSSANRTKELIGSEMQQ